MHPNNESSDRDSLKSTREKDIILDRQHTSSNFPSSVHILQIFNSPFLRQKLYSYCHTTEVCVEKPEKGNAVFPDWMLFSLDWREFWELREIM
jgi:hypothetical protein